MKVYVYKRVSTDEQLLSGAGLAAQEDICRDWVKGQNGTIASVFVDAGVSGSTNLDKRPALLEAINQLQKGDVLLVAKRDRIGRDVIHVAMIEAAVNRKGASLISANGEGTMDSDPSSILMKRMVDAFAEFERNIICQRTKVAMQAKKKKNQRVGHIPLGFMLSNDKIHIEECPKEQTVLKKIYSLHRAGKSLREIATRMNEKECFNRDEARWSYSAIGRMINRPKLKPKRRRTTK